MDQRHRLDHGDGWWTSSAQAHCGPLKNLFQIIVNMCIRITYAKVNKVWFFKIVFYIITNIIFKLIL